MTIPLRFNLATCLMTKRKTLLADRADPATVPPTTLFRSLARNPTDPFLGYAGRTR